jgi:hypothetical protein
MNPQTLKPGRERRETFYSHFAKRRMIQYDYRHANGELFSCIAESEMEIYDKRTAWAKKHGYELP